MVTVVFALYFREVVVADQGRADALWGRIAAVSELLVALIAPVLGAIADFSGSRKRFLAASVATVVFFTATLWFVGPGMAALGFWLFVAANVGFAGGGVFIDSFLPGLSTPANAGRISGMKWAMGYASGLVALVVCIPLSNSLDRWTGGELAAEVAAARADGRAPPSRPDLVPEDAVCTRVDVVVGAAASAGPIEVALTRNGGIDSTPRRTPGATADGRVASFTPDELWAEPRGRRERFGVGWTDRHERDQLAAANFGFRVYGPAPPTDAVSLRVHYRHADGATGEFGLAGLERRDVLPGVTRFVRGGRDPARLTHARLVPLVIALYFLVAAIPTFLWLRDRSVSQPLPPGDTYLTVGFRRLAATFRNFRHYRDLFRLFIAFLIYNEGVVTVIFFAALYAVGTVGFEASDLILMFLFIQVVAVIGALGFGALADRIGQKRTILISLGIWIVAVALAGLVPTKPAFFVVAGLAGLGIGSAQSVTRSLVALFTPPAKSAEFFGFLGITGKALAFTGPLLYGELSQALGQRVAVLSVAVFFVVGGAMLCLVDEARGKAAARAPVE